MAEIAESHKTFAQLVAAGVSEMRAAARCGLTPGAARAIMRSPLFKALVQKERTDLVGPILERTRKILEEAVPDAIQTIVDLSKTAKTESVRKSAAESILSWAGAIPKEEKVEAGLTVIIEGEAAARLQGLAQMMSVIDVVPTAAQTIALIQQREELADGDDEGSISGVG